MKRLLAFIILISPSIDSMAQGTAARPAAIQETMVLKEPSFDFGKIQQGRPVTHEFELVNASADTLRLENVQASCGCTTPVWKKDAVLPGNSTHINVGYNAAAEGLFEKTVSIVYNGGQIKTLTIKGDVYKAPATSAPQNTSIQLLKQTNQ